MSKANVAKKKNLKGWKKVAAIAGGAALGAVNPFKVVKAVKTASKVVKASKYTKAATSAKKTTKVVKKVKAKPKQTIVAKKSTQEAFKKATAKKTAQTVKKQQKTVKAACFTAGTKIHTKDGYKNIEAIKVGDYVWSENPETKEKALKKVKKIFVREKDSIIRLAINGEAIETTDEHPFYVEGKGFTEAKWLKAGDEVRLATGDTAEVETIESVQLDSPVKVYNFEVEDFHTYYVSGQKVLVHNTCSKTTTKSKGVNNNEYSYYLDLVERLDVSTAPNTATFYSGPGNRALAESFAIENGKTTLELTPGGKYLDSLRLFDKDSPLTKKQATAVWSRLSQRYAEGASGNVYAFVNGSRPDSIFNTVEYPALARNTAVTQVFTELFK